MSESTIGKSDATIKEQRSGFKISEANLTINMEEGMKRLMIGLMVFIVAVAFANPSKAEEETYYAGKIIDYQSDGRDDQDGVRFYALREVTIKDENGDIRKFKIKEATMDGFPPKVPDQEGYVWLEVKSGTPTFVALLPEGVIIQEIQKMFRDIRQEAQNNLTREGSSPKEHEIMYEAWKITASESWTAPESKKELLEQIGRYFWIRFKNTSGG